MSPSRERPLAQRHTLTVDLGTGGPKVAFSYTVRDDLTNPADPFATSIAAPADASGSAQSNVSGPATVTMTS